MNHDAHVVCAGSQRLGRNITNAPRLHLRLAGDVNAIQEHGHVRAVNGRFVRGKFTEDFRLFVRGDTGMRKI